MPPFDEMAPSILLLSLLGKLEEMVTCVKAINIIRTIVTAKSHTILPSSFRGSGRIFRGIRTFTHPVKTSITFEDTRDINQTFFVTHEMGHLQPRYHVCAVTSPIWRQEL